MKWACKDGRLIDIKDMSDSHLANTIAMLKRNHFDIEWAAKLQPYLSPTVSEMSDASQDAIDMELRQLEEQMVEAGVEAWWVYSMVLFHNELIETYRAMKEELARRAECDCMDCSIAEEAIH